MITTYSKIDDSFLELNKSKKYHEKHVGMNQFSIVLNGSIYRKNKNSEKFLVQNFHSDISISCSEHQPECLEASVLSFKPDTEGEYFIEYKPLYIPTRFKLNGDLFISIGAMKFNPSYITLNLVNKILNLIFLTILFIFYTNGLKKVKKELLCTEQKYIKTMAIILFFVNEPFTSFSLEMSEKYGILNLVFSSGFYSFVLYFWLVLYEVRL